MLDIWMRSIARAGGIEIPPDCRFVEPAAPAAPPARRRVRLADRLAGALAGWSTPLETRRPATR